MQSRRTSMLDGCTNVSSNGSMPTRPAAISALRSRSESSTRRAYLLTGAGRLESAEVRFPTCGVAAPGGRHMDVVVVAHPGRLGAARCVVDATPDRILYPESRCVLQDVRDDRVSQSDALGALGVGNHHIERQTEGMPRQRIRSDATDFVNLRERRADAARRQ